MLKRTSEATLARLALRDEAEYDAGSPGIHSGDTAFSIILPTPQPNHLKTPTMNRACSVLQVHRRRRSTISHCPAPLRIGLASSLWYAGLAACPRVSGAHNIRSLQRRRRRGRRRRAWGVFWQAELDSAQCQGGFISKIFPPRGALRRSCASQAGQVRLVKFAVPAHTVRHLRQWHRYRYR
jgi:hypothetical protein